MEPEHDPAQVLLRRTLTRGGEPPVEVRETHCSWVFLTRDRAYKLKKPVRFGFVDLTTAARRRQACLEEERVNAALAPGVVLGVRGLVPVGDRCVLVAPQTWQATDWVVVMRRFDEHRTLAALIARGEPADDAVDAVAARIARFHATTGRYAGGGHAAEVLSAFDRNVEELLPLAGSAAPRRSLLAIQRFAGAFVAGRRGELEARGRSGLVRDGHGDLRAEHVLLEHEVAIVDRLEFDARLRRVDVADDVAFLAMDLEALGAPAAARRLIASYRAAGGDAGDDGLVAFFAMHRALVRAKVEALRAEQLADPGDRRRRERRATDLVALAERLAWRARGRRVLLVHGPPASGKSFLAAALAARSGLPVLGTDAIRRELLRVPAGARAPDAAYDTVARRRVYAELGDRARTALAGGSVIVDATCGDPAARGAFFEALAGGRDAVHAVRCQTRRTTLLRRAAARAGRRGELSDAGPAEAGRLAAQFAELDEVPHERLLVVDGESGADDLVDEIGDWLDRRLAPATAAPSVVTTAPP
jgi:aminoglycoside phosphotransferase family enzyme/predicted kinase